ncbi:hypothetical protein EJB05_01727, partial [Eragrostis curvula]
MGPFLYILRSLTLHFWNIMQGKTVPIQNSSFLWPVLLLAATAATGEGLTVMPGCQGSCGGVDIPYPFGPGSGCFRNGFEISCINSGTAGGEMPVLATTNNQTIRVLNLSVAPWPEARVMLPVAYQCFNSSGDRIKRFTGDVNVNPDGVYRISNASNELYVLGCNTLAYTNSGVRGRYKYTYYTGCVAFSNDLSLPRDGACAGVGCCHVDIPPGLTDNKMTLAADGWSHKDQEFCPCDYAFIVEKGNYTFRESHLTSMPLRLDWAIRDYGTTSMTCAQAANKPDYACVSRRSECVDSTNGPGYVCNCTKGYEGNPYVVDGCTGIIVGIFGLIATLLGARLMRKHRELKANKGELEEKERELEAIAKKNGSEILKNVKTLMIFTKEEINDITENNARYLGCGCFGKVHKGTLPDKTDVAVKESIEVTENTKGEFVKELEIQSRMMHRNILKLLGCCLCVDLPLLVYEYAAKGNLQDILHGNETPQPQPLPLNSRLNIAIGSAQGLAYMHTYTENGIQHADVKPSNILLDGELVPKISDFGLSKVFKAGKKYTEDVVGCLDYMDPMSIINNRLTPKSDVYSFGIVLLELICRKPVVYCGRRLTFEFKRVYDKDKSGKAMFDKEIAQEENVPLLDEIGILAMKCLNENFEERPAMESVASALVILKDTWETKSLPASSNGLPLRPVMQPRSSGSGSIHTLPRRLLPRSVQSRLQNILRLNQSRKEKEASVPAVAGWPPFDGQRSLRASPGCCSDEHLLRCARFCAITSSSSCVDDMEEAAAATQPQAHRLQIPCLPPFLLLLLNVALLPLLEDIVASLMIHPPSKCSSPLPAKHNQLVRTQIDGPYEAEHQVTEECYNVSSNEITWQEEKGVQKYTNASYLMVNV